METLTAWPANNPSEIHSFYGKFQLGNDGRPTPGWEETFLAQITTPFRLRLAWSDDVTINRVTCHKEVVNSLHRIFGELLNYFETPEAISKAGYDVFGGAYEFRLACASNKLSMHAYGAAIRLGRVRSPKYVPSEDDEKVDLIFEAEGWRWLGISEGWGALGE